MLLVEKFEFVSLLILAQILLYIPDVLLVKEL